MLFQVQGKTAYAYTADHPPQPAKPSVVFVHGAGLDHSWWALQSRYFGYHGRNVLAVDLPAHGRSAGPALGTIEEMADWTLQLVDATGLGDVAIVGHSMGSLVALECAARHPERVKRAALVATAFPMTVSSAFLEAARNNERAAYDMHTIWGHVPQAPLRADPNPGMSMYGDSLARLARLAPGVLHADLKACDDYASGLVSAARVRCPVLFVLGGSDVMTPPRAAQALIQATPGAKTVPLGGTGHALMAEAPDATLDALAAFLAN